MKSRITEGKASLVVFVEEKVSKDLPVFYNPVMKFNRDISILLLLSLGRKGMQIADPLAGSGVRSLRFLSELPKSMIESISLNDSSKESLSLIKRNLALNKRSKEIGKRVILSQNEANKFLLGSNGFDYIDIDPFGSPAPFLDCAIKRISREGILAITATDTAALCGTYPKTCLRRYWATPKKGPMMHETALRILIRKAQLIGSQYEKALIPIFSYSKDHYFRIFFLCQKSNDVADEIMSKMGELDGAGPLFLGNMWDPSLVEKMLSIAKKEKSALFEKELLSFLSVIVEESRVDAPGIFDTHALSLDSAHLPKKAELIEKIRKKGYKASNTHIKGEGLRSTIPKEEFLKLVKK